jgi:uncharacterized protein
MTSCCCLRIPGTLRAFTPKPSSRWSISRPLCTIDASIQEEIRVANVEGKGLWEISNTCDKGWGIYALSKIPKFTKVFRAHGLAKAPERHSHSVQIGWNEHVIMNLPARFINHSCSANVGIKDNTVGAFDFFTLQDVAQGTELTWDYGAAEFDSISFKECLCGSPVCRGTRIGFGDAHQDIRSQYGAHYAQYLHDWSP